MDIIEQIRIDDIMKQEEDDDKEANSDSGDEKEDLDPVHYARLADAVSFKKDPLFSTNSNGTHS